MKSLIFKHKYWSIFLGLAVVNAVGLLLSQFIIRGSIAPNALISFIGLSVACGFFGALPARKFMGFTLGFSAFNLIGIGYLLYVSIAMKQSGWADLVGLVSYLYALGLGLVFGFTTEIGLRIYKHYKR